MSAPTSQSYAAVVKSTVTIGCQTNLEPSPQVATSGQTSTQAKKSSVSESTVKKNTSMQKPTSTKKHVKESIKPNSDLLSKFKGVKNLNLKGLPKGQNKFEILADNEDFEDMDDMSYPPSHIPSMVSMRPPPPPVCSYEDIPPDPPDPPPTITSPLSLPIPSTQDFFSSKTRATYLGNALNNDVN